MLTILDRYIGMTLIKSSALTMFVVLILRAFFMYMDELRDVGKGAYDAIDALLYVTLNMPTLVYEFFPMCVLLGGLLGLGSLAAKSEIIVMRASGVSTARIVGSVLKTSLALMLLVIVIGEIIAPESVQIGHKIRTVAISEGELVDSDKGIWSKDEDSVIHMERVFTSGMVAGVTMFKINPDLALEKVVYAESAVYSLAENAWVLSGVKETIFGAEKLKINRYDELHWQSKFIAPDKLDTIGLDPSELNLVGLLRQIDYLEANGLESRAYRLSLWRKVLMPFSVGVMMFMALSFIFGPLRSVTMGARLLTGMIAGFAFHVINQVFGNLASELTPFMGASIPILLFAFFAFWMIKRA